MPWRPGGRGGGRRRRSFTGADEELARADTKGRARTSAARRGRRGAGGEVSGEAPWLAGGAERRTRRGGPRVSSSRRRAVGGAAAGGGGCWRARRRAGLPWPAKTDARDGGGPRERGWGRRRSAAG
jgi:hypothetical protein